VGEEKLRLGIKEMIFVGEQINSAELQPLVCLLEARGQGLLKSALDGDEFCTNTNMRALSSSLAGGGAEVASIGQREGWSEGIKKRDNGEITDNGADSYTEGGRASHE
jgi:hypothetical protein